MKDETLVIDDAFSDELNIKLNEFMKNAPWYYGRKPHPDAPFAFWGTTFYQRPEFMDLGVTQNLHADAKILGDIMTEIAPKLNGQYEILQIASNGQTYGQDGHMHPDDHKDGTYTMLVYVNTEWKVDWGGETRFFIHGNPHDTKGNSKEDIWSVLPMPRRAVFFNSQIVHMGSAPNRVFDGLRMTLAYKMKKVG